MVAAVIMLKHREPKPEGIEQAPWRYLQNARSRWWRSTARESALSREVQNIWTRHVKLVCGPEFWGADPDMTEVAEFYNNHQRLPNAAKQVSNPQEAVAAGILGTIREAKGTDVYETNR
jgi:hypothetical protein